MLGKCKRKEERLMPVKLGDEAPNCAAQTTQGEIDFHEWLKPYIRVVPQPK